MLNFTKNYFCISVYKDNSKVLDIYNRNDRITATDKLFFFLEETHAHCWDSNELDLLILIEYFKISTRLMSRN